MREASRSSKISQSRLRLHRAQRMPVNLDLASFISRIGHDFVQLGRGIPHLPTNFRHRLTYIRHHITYIHRRRASEQNSYYVWISWVIYNNRIIHSAPTMPVIGYISGNDGVLIRHRLPRLPIGGRSIDTNLCSHLVSFLIIFKVSYLLTLIFSDFIHPHSPVEFPIFCKLSYTSHPLVDEAFSKHRQLRLPFGGSSSAWPNQSQNAAASPGRSKYHPRFFDRPPHRTPCAPVFLTPLLQSIRDRNPPIIVHTHWRVLLGIFRPYFLKI